MTWCRCRRCVPLRDALKIEAAVGTVLQMMSQLRQQRGGEVNPPDASGEAHSASISSSSSKPRFLKLLTSDCVHDAEGARGNVTQLRQSHSHFSQTQCNSEYLQQGVAYLFSVLVVVAVAAVALSKPSSGQPCLG